MDEVNGRSRGLTRDQISRIPTGVFKSGTGPDTIKSKSCERLARNAANPATTSTEKPTGRAKVDDSNGKSAKGLEAIDAMKECNICMNKFVNNEKIRILTCFHEFHIQCIDEWIKVRVVSTRERGKYEGKKSGVRKYVSNHLLCYNHLLPFIIDLYLISLLMCNQIF